MTCKYFKNTFEVFIQAHAIIQPYDKYYISNIAFLSPTVQSIVTSFPAII